MLSFLNLGPSLPQFVSTRAVSLLLRPGTPIFEPMCVFSHFFFCLCFSHKNGLRVSFESLFAIVLLSPQQFHCYFYLNIVSWQYDQKYWSILILVLFFCVWHRWFAHLTQALPRLHLSSEADDRGIVNYLHIHLFSKVHHRRGHISPRRPMYLLIVGSDDCVMRFEYELHMRPDDRLNSRIYTIR